MYQRLYDFGSWNTFIFTWDMGVIKGGPGEVVKIFWTPTLPGKILKWIKSVWKLGEVEKQTIFIIN